MSKARAKGTSFETAILPWLKALWPDASRTGSKSFEAGDFERTGPYIIEAKNQKEMKLAAWVKQVTLAALRVGAWFPIVVHKRRMFGPQGSYVTMTLETFVKVILHERHPGWTRKEVESYLASLELTDVSDLALPDL